MSWTLALRRRAESPRAHSPYRDGVSTPSPSIQRTDALLGVGVALAWCSAVWLLAESPLWSPSSRGSYLWVGVVLGVVLALRRTAPLAGLWWALGLSVLSQRYGLLSYFHLVPLAVAGFTVVRRGVLDWWKAVPPVVAVTATFFIRGVPFPQLGVALWEAGLNVNMVLPGFDSPLFYAFNPSTFVQAQTLVVGSLLLGHVFRRLDLTRAELEQRNAELLALQHAEADLAVTAERNRISRELHDVVAHHVTAIVVRAQAATHVAHTKPEAAPEALRWIAREGKEALTATRSMVHTLRADGASAPLAPGDLLAELNRTAQRVAGERQVRVDLPALAPAVSRDGELALVRIAQEAVTNVVLHSRAETLTLSLREVENSVLLDVVDPGPALERSASDNSGGNGLVHMRERALAVGGNLRVGPDGDGWRVSARVPLAGAYEGEQHG